MHNDSRGHQRVLAMTTPAPAHAPVFGELPPQAALQAPLNGLGVGVGHNRFYGIVQRDRCLDVGRRPVRRNHTAQLALDCCPNEGQVLHDHTRTGKER
jgi:hypothetical protein